MTPLYQHVFTREEFPVAAGNVGMWVKYLQITPYEITVVKTKMLKLCLLQKLMH